MAAVFICEFLPNKTPSNPGLPAAFVRDRQPQSVLGVGCPAKLWRSAMPRPSRFAVAAFAYLLCCGRVGIGAAATPPELPTVPENVYRGQMAAYPGPWAFDIPRQSIILVRDAELEEMSADPDKVMDLSCSPSQKWNASLRQICESCKQQGLRTLIVAFDAFFQQYRPGQNHERRLMPDSDGYIEKIAKIGKFAGQYGLGLELSLITPLEIGRNYRQATGESGLWMQYRKGLRDPVDGKYSVQLWRHSCWTNNKGPFMLEDAGVRVFAFREQAVPGTPYRVVPEDAITEITKTAQVEVMQGIHADGIPAVQIRVHGIGKTEAGGLNRVLVVQMYRTPEMDCFSDKALPYLKGLVDRYANAGIKLNGLYSDEPHLMGDWSYHQHHDHGQFAMRYVSPGFVEKFAKRYGEKYRDFAKYLVYFAYGQEDAAIDLNATQGVMHVFGPTPQDIRRTALFRAWYYQFLQDGVADLLVQAKRHAEQRMGHRLEARGHATWAESPTCDSWIPAAGENSFRSQYEYTSDFRWSNTVQQAAVACADYFRWGDFLTGNGNDHAEGGYLDRNYTGLALACSTGILNEVPYSYAGHWGMPGAISYRRDMLAACFGVASSSYGAVQGLQHRDVDVLMLYPLDLTAVEEKFGSWMTQYAYTNYVTQAKLLERGRVVGGAIEMAGRRFTTLATTFEPFPSKRLLDMMRQLVDQGGRVVWSGPPPILTEDGGDALGPWSALFGVTYQPSCNEGQPAPGRQVAFSGVLKNVPPQIILNHELVDHIYPVTAAGATPVAQVQGRTVGTIRSMPKGGVATFLGFRPRDNQSRSLGYDVRTWFDVLNALGAYPSSGKFPGVNDNTEYLSRTGDYLACHFPNGTVTIARHLRLTEEDWSGGFGRDPAADAAYEASHPMPTDKLELRDFKVHGHSVTYDGTGAVAFRLDAQGTLVAFAGRNCREIAIDGRTTVLSEKPMSAIAFFPISEAQRVPGGAVYGAEITGDETVRIPAGALPAKVKLFAAGATPGSKGAEVPCHRETQSLVIDKTAGVSGRRLWIVPAQ
jgi:hypothetical protein